MAVSERASLPAPREDGFVGSSACRGCHQEIYQRYAQHPMSRSVGHIGEVATIEDYESNELVRSDRLEYQIERLADGTVWHHERMVDDSGELIFDRGHQITIAIGSGQRGRAYLIEKEGTLYQSPVGWYATDHRFGLSPGYEPGHNRRFERRIDSGCLYCHAGRMNANPEIPSHSDSPVFAETAIGCERCHGPGKRHIQLHTAQSSLKDVDPIVNPARLDHAKSEAVCNQCHIQGHYAIRRFGRDFFSFRPGDRLEDALVILVGGDRVTAEGQSLVVSQVEQMRASACYLGTDGALGCTSCHNPHYHPTETERVAYYRDRCLSCHSEQTCTLPAIEQEATPAKGSCVHCHMPSLQETNVPHTPQTNHQITRHNARPLATPTNPLPAAWLHVFDDAERNLPAWEVRRAKGIALMTDAWNRSDIQLAHQARAFLLPDNVDENDINRAVADLGVDVPALAELGASYLLTDDPQFAKVCWRRVLELAPDNDTALGGLAAILLNEGDYLGCERHLNRLIELYPFESQWYAQRAKLYWQAQDEPLALADGERFLELIPDSVAMRKWIIEGYQRTGKPARAAIHAALLERLAAPTTLAP